MDHVRDARGAEQFPSLRDEVQGFADVVGAPLVCSEGLARRRCPYEVESPERVTGDVDRVRLRERVRVFRLLFEIDPLNLEAGSDEPIARAARAAEKVERLHRVCSQVMQITLSEDAAKRLTKIADEESVAPCDMVEALIAAETARREARAITTDTPPHDDR